MTPTVARMVAGRQRDLPVPIRWYSIPNIFRYEKPQRGRLREHYQLNVDIFGAEQIEADIEMIRLSSFIMHSFNATDEDFLIKINNRQIINDLYNHFEIPIKDRKIVSHLLDRQNKMSERDFERSLANILGKKTLNFLTVISTGRALAETLSRENENIKNLIVLVERLEANGIKNIQFTPTLMRGFDYYTGLIFETFDTAEENARSLFGGGRYNDLLTLFGKKSLPAIGFGMGDVGMRNFLETHDLLSELPSKTDLYICRASAKAETYIDSLAASLRQVGVNVEVDFTTRRIAGQIKAASKKGIPFITCIGEDEDVKKEVIIKDLKTSNETTVSENKIAQFLIERRSTHL